MKITIDTTFKPHKVEIEGDCSIGELIEFLSKYYPDFTWRDVRIGGKYGISLGGYTGTTTTPWVQPHTTQPWPTIGTPFPGSTITYCSDTNSFTNAAGDTIQVTNLSNLISG